MKYDFDLIEMDDKELLNTYSMYLNCLTRGVSDEIRLNYIENELNKRGLA